MTNDELHEMETRLRATLPAPDAHDVRIEIWYGKISIQREEDRSSRYCGTDEEEAKATIAALVKEATPEDLDDLRRRGEARMREMYRR